MVSELPIIVYVIQILGKPTVLNILSCDLELLIQSAALLQDQLSVILLHAVLNLEDH